MRGAPSWATRSGPDDLVQPQSVIRAKPTSTAADCLRSPVNVTEQHGQEARPTMRLPLILLLLAFASPGLAAPLNATTQVKVRAVFRLLVGLNGEGRSTVASLSRETTRITHNNITGRTEDAVGEHRVHMPCTADRHQGRYHARRVAFSMST